MSTPKLERVLEGTSSLKNKLEKPLFSYTLRVNHHCLLCENIVTRRGHAVPRSSRVGVGSE